MYDLHGGGFGLLSFEGKKMRMTQHDVVKSLSSFDEYINSNGEKYYVRKFRVISKSGELFNFDCFSDNGIDLVVQNVPL